MKIFVSGLVNIETTVAVRGFPISYYPIDFNKFGISSNVSGVGYNLAKALTTLGDEVELHSFIGSDEEAERILSRMDKDGVDSTHIARGLMSTPVSAVLYAPDGKRQIYCDLKDIQDQVIEPDSVKDGLSSCGAAILCNIAFNRGLIKAAHDAGVTTATDVHVLADIDDEYNRGFMENADILFLSDEKLPCPAQDFIRQLQWAMEAFETERSLNRCALALQERIAAEQKVKIPVTTCKARIYEALNFFHVDMNVPLKVWENVYADQFEKIAQFAALKGDIKSQVKATEHALEKTRNSLAGRLGAEVIVQALAQPIEKVLAKHINDILKNNSGQMVKGLVKEESAKLMNMSMSSLASGHDEQVAQIKSGLLNAYRVIITEHLPRILQDIDISGIIEQRINDMDMNEAEAIILDVMKKELRAIVWFGALLGSIMGTVTSLWASQSLSTGCHFASSFIT